MTLFKHLVTGKKQPGGPGRGKGRGGQAAGEWRTAGEETKMWKEQHQKISEVE